MALQITLTGREESMAEVAQWILSVGSEIFDTTLVKVEARGWT